MSSPDTFGAERLHRRLRDEGGFTLHPETGEQPSSGYAVCVDQRLSRGIAWDAWDHHNVARWLSSLASDLRRGSHFLGGWLDPDNGCVWLEVVVVVPEDQRAAAFRLANREGQQAMFDLASATVVPVGAHDACLAGGVPR